MQMDSIEERLAQADLFVSVGTSGSVYPAAGFVEQAKHLGIRTCEINLEPSDNAWLFDETHYGPATQTVPAWVERILAAQEAGAYGVMMFLELNKEQLSVLRRALEARTRDMQMRLGSDPGDEGFRREATLSIQLLRQVEALERRAGHRAWGIGNIESMPEDNDG